MTYTIKQLTIIHRHTTQTQWMGLHCYGEGVPVNLKPLALLIPFTIGWIVPVVDWVLAGYVATKLPRRHWFRWNI